MKPRTALLPALAAIALAVPVAANAATLNANRPCYGPGQEIVLSGGGFTPSGQVAISVGGRQLGETTANPIGEIDVRIGAPQIGGKTRTDFYTATDQADLSLIANVPVRLTALNVEVTPRNGNPAQRKRVVARGFTTGKVLWAHIRRGKSKRNVRIGKLEGACKTLDVKRRMFSADAKAGLYSVQFDTKRKYSKKTVPQVSFLVTVFHTFSPASVSSAGWIQVD